MYQAHFGLKKSLFDGGIAQDAAVFVGTQQKLIAANFKVALTTLDSAVVLTGLPGVGKTTLTSTALRTISTRLALGWLSGSPANGAELLEVLLVEFGIDAHRVGRVERMQMWRQFLNEMNATDSRVFVIAERADDLAPEVLRAAESLTAADPNGSLGANLVLLGQPAFNEALKSPLLDTLRQRVRLRQRLEPLTAAELPSYLAHHVELAGGRFDNVFAAGAVEALYRCSHGIPRIANNVCETALMLAATEGTRPITAELVARVADLFGIDAAPAAAPALSVAPALPAAPLANASAPDATATPPTANTAVSSLPPAPSGSAAPPVPTPAAVAAHVPTSAAPPTMAATRVSRPAQAPTPQPAWAAALPAAAGPVALGATAPIVAAAPVAPATPVAPAAPIAAARVSAPPVTVAVPIAAPPSDDSFTITTVDTPDVAIVDFPILTDAVETPDFRATATAVEEEDPSIAALARAIAPPAAAATPAAPRARIVERTPAPSVARRPAVPPVAPPAAAPAAPPRAAAAASAPPVPRIPTPIPPAAASAPRAAAPLAPAPKPAAAPPKPAPAAKAPAAAPHEDEDLLHQTQTMRALATAKSIDDISSSMAETLFGDEDLDMLSAALASAGWSEDSEPAAKPAAPPKAGEPEPTNDPFDFFNLGPDAPLELIDDPESPTDRTRKIAGNR